MSEEMKHQPLILYPDRGKYLKTNGALFLLSAGLTFLAFAPRHRAGGWAKLLILFSRALLLLWGWFYVPGFLRLLFPKPLVTINDSGISYDPPRIGPLSFRSSLAWKGIEALYISELTTRQRGRRSTQRVLCVLPRDVEAFLQPYALLNKTVLTLLLTQAGSPFAIPESVIPIPVDELLAHVRTHYADVISAYGIEIRQA